MNSGIQPDGWELPEVGRWSKRKYHFLDRYLRMFSSGMKNKWPERHYIDLFAGAGLVRLRDGGEIVQGSPLIAASVPDHFTRLHLCESDQSRMAALRARLDTVPQPLAPVTVTGDANEKIDAVLRDIPRRRALCVTFADPYGLHLEFETVRKVAELQSDLIILLADNMDALRNWAKYYFDNPNSTLDRFMGEPGWRERLLAANSDQQAAVIREGYVDQLRSRLGYSHFAFERVQNDRGHDIYSLVYASRSPVGLKFWKAAAAVDEGGQRVFGF